MSRIYLETERPAKVLKGLHGGASDFLAKENILLNNIVVFLKTNCFLLRRLQTNFFSGRGANLKLCQQSEQLIKQLILGGNGESSGVAA